MQCFIYIHDKICNMDEEGHQGGNKDPLAKFLLLHRLPLGISNTPCFMLKYVEIDDGYLMYAQCEGMGG